MSLSMCLRAIDTSSLLRSPAGNVASQRSIFGFTELPAATIAATSLPDTGGP